MTSRTRDAKERISKSIEQKELVNQSPQCAPTQWSSAEAPSASSWGFWPVFCLKEKRKKEKEKKIEKTHCLWIVASLRLFLTDEAVTSTATLTILYKTLALTVQKLFATASLVKPKDTLSVPFTLCLRDSFKTLSLLRQNPCVPHWFHGSLF